MGIFWNKLGPKLKFCFGHFGEHFGDKSVPNWSHFGDLLGNVLDNILGIYWDTLETLWGRIRDNSENTEDTWGHFGDS